MVVLLSSRPESGDELANNLDYVMSNITSNVGYLAISSSRNPLASVSAFVSLKDLFRPVCGRMANKYSTCKLKYRLVKL